MPSPQETAAITALVRQQAAARDRLATNVVELVRRLVARFSGWYDDRQVAQLADALARVIRTGQTATAGSTGHYLQLVLRRMDAAPRAVSVDLPADLRPGVSLVDEMARVAETYRWARSTGRSDGEALRAATARAVLLADTDVTLAMREGARQVLDAVPDVTGYRRVLHPELAKHGSCGLCIAASDRVYRTGELLPIHQRCNCEVLPIVGDLDPGQSLNRRDLNALYRAAGSTGAADLKKVRAVVNEHGELGPILGREGQEFTGPAATAGRRAASASDVRVDPAAVLASAERTVVDLEARAAAGEDVAGPLTYQRELIARMRERVAA